MPTLPPPTRTRPPSPTAPPVRRGKPDLSPRAFRVLWDGHSVVGVVLGLALYVMFLCGGIALWRGEVHQWADPALRAASTEVASVDALVGPVLAADPPVPGSGVMVVWPFGNRPYLTLSYETASGPASHWVVPETGAVLPARPRSATADLLNDVHFFHQLGIVGDTLAGLACVFLLFVLGSGLAIHWRKLPKDWHTTRWGGGLRRALADVHVVLGTLGLPFTVAYAVTGAYFALLTVFYGAVVAGALGGDLDRLDPLISGLESPAYEASGQPAETLSFDRLVAALPAEWPALDPVILRVEGWGDRAGLAHFEGQQAGTVTRSAIAVLGAATGEVVAARAPSDTPAMTATAVGMGTLHFGRFGGGVTKALLFLLALAASAVILTGNVLWVVVRRPRDSRATPRLHRALARLTVGVGCGLVAAVPALFLATRALPLALDGRQRVEAAVFFGLWLALAVAAFAGRSAGWAARWQLALAGALCLAVPVANGVGTGAWPWVSAAAGWPAVFWTDVGFAMAGLTLLGAARWLPGPGAGGQGARAGQSTNTPWATSPRA